MEDKSEAFTGRAALSFDVSRNTSVYGLFATSFDPVLSLDADGQILEPTTGEIFELGVKSDWLDGKLGVNAAVFRLDRENIPVASGRVGGRTVFSSSGLQRSEGVELEINGAPLPGWNLSFGGILLDAEFLGNEDADPNVGRTPNGSADWQVGLFSSYELQTGPFQGLGAGVGVYAIADRGVANQDNKLEGYERVDLSLFYNGFENTSIGLQLRNVFDATYVETAFSAGDSSFIGAPLSALLTVRHQFGK